MSQEMECMCLECGISLYLNLETISVDDFSVTGMKIVSNCFCTECGGQLMLVGKAGDQPHYIVG